jgi:hypothetical protein
MIWGLPDVEAGLEDEEVVEKISKSMSAERGEDIVEGRLEGRLEGNSVVRVRQHWLLGGRQFQFFSTSVAKNRVYVV